MKDITQQSDQGLDLTQIAGVTAPASVPAPACSPDPFADLNALRLGQDFEVTLGMKKILTSVPVHKPNKQDFIRIHPDPAFRLETAVLELKEDREIYLVARTLWDVIPREISPRVLFTGVTRQNVVFLWAARRPAPDGRRDAWAQSALEAATYAMQNWVRVVPNIHLGAYEIMEASGTLSDPQWPDLNFNDLCRLAFRERYIDQVDHPVLKRLRGEW